MDGYRRRNAVEHVDYRSDLHSPCCVKLGSDRNGYSYLRARQADDYH
jgi:hypothetical protein